MAEIEYLTIDHLSTKDLIRIFSRVQFGPTSFNGSLCWLSTRAQCKGYTYIWLDATQKRELLHRIVFAWLVSPLPLGRKNGELDHLCRNRPCCNPLHLELVTTQINVLRGESFAATNAQKTHCPQGHPLSGHNLYRYKDGRRECRKCLYARIYAWTAQRKRENPEAANQKNREYKRRRRAAAKVLVS